MAFSESLYNQISSLHVALYSNGIELNIASIVTYSKRHLSENQFCGNLGQWKRL